MTPNRVIGQSPEDGSAGGHGSYPRESDMTQMTERKEGYGKSMHAIESKPFEVSKYEEEEEEDGVLDDADNVDGEE